MKKIIFYCQTNYRSALVHALIYLGILNIKEINFKSFKELTWWSRLNKLKPGHILEIGRDEKGDKIFILSVPRDIELLPKIVTSFCYELTGKRNFFLKKATPSTNTWIKIGHIFALGGGNQSLSHYFFLKGLFKWLKEN